jgi:5-methylcytosine-specific restriction protein A
MSVLKTMVEKLRISAPTKKRSPRWPITRLAHLHTNPSCAACGATTKLEVHHKAPFQTNPQLELDPKNLITLCESTSDGIICHLCVGHIGNYKEYNSNVEEDAARILRMLKGGD